MVRASIFAIFILSILFSACEKYVDLNQHDCDPLLVVNGLMSDTSTLHVYVSESIPVSRFKPTDETYIIRNAEVLLYEDGLLLCTLTFNRGTFTYYNPDFMPAYGSHYRVEVNASGYETVSVETTMPAPVPIEHLEVQREYVPTSDGSELRYTLNVTFTDPPNEENYYYMEAVSYRERTPYYPYRQFLLSTEPSSHRISFGYEITILFNDRGFDGQRINYSVFYDYYEFYRDAYDYVYEDDYMPDDTAYHYTYVEPIQIPVVVKHELRLVSISEEMYKYIYSYNLHRDEYYEPYAEPVLIYSAAKNGIGVLGAFSVSSRQIEK